MTVEDRRIKLSDMLHSIFDYPDQIYFDPPEGKKIVYPAIIYERQKVNTTNADNKKYFVWDRYQLTYISKRRDDPMLDRILSLPYCEHDRPFKKDDLYHDVFTIYIS